MASPRLKRPAAIERAIELFPILGGAAAPRPRATLSGGETADVVTARVLPPPRLLIAGDLPGLAPLVVEKVFDGLQRVIQLGVSVVLIEQFGHRALQRDRRPCLRRGAWCGGRGVRGGHRTSGALPRRVVRTAPRDS
jgi:branched-chain amino acid transport system ATP-binding protein